MNTFSYKNYLRTALGRCLCTAVVILTMCSGAFAESDELLGGVHELSVDFTETNWKPVDNILDYIKNGSNKKITYNETADAKLHVYSKVIANRDGWSSALMVVKISRTVHVSGFVGRAIVAEERSVLLGKSVSLNDAALDPVIDDLILGILSRIADRNGAE